MPLLRKIWIFHRGKWNLQLNSRTSQSAIRGKTTEIQKTRHRMPNNSRNLHRQDIIPQYIKAQKGIQDVVLSTNYAAVIRIKNPSLSPIAKTPNK